MSFDAASFPPGTIIIPTNVVSRFADFHIALQNTRIPPGTHIKFAMGTSIDGNRNRAVSEATGEWAWFLDDDHVWHPDTLLKLLSHDVDVVSPITCKRIAPWQPLAYGRTDEQGNYVPLYLPDEEPKLREVIATSTAGMLVKKEVLQEMSYPWFEMGKISPETTGEDLYFCHKVRKLGFKIFVDLTTAMPHIHIHHVSIAHSEEMGWYTNLGLDEGKNIAFPRTEK